ncbi:fumarylacetoacetate hydrolase family protein [Pseudonocardia ailaonensis]|uniref:Fumarylacetoacetate hydrolase family protein n=1 Tax=Pseudonocardia ailaonensis TaxID=367279 RepID=A0ABN2NBD1_9PSEU
MKLASLKNGTRDGALVVVSRDLKRAVEVGSIAPTLQAALDDWATVRPQLERVSEELNAGDVPGAFAFDEPAVESALPRAYQWLDGSTYLSHYNRIKPEMLVTGLEPPADGIPILYQGTGDDFQPPHGDLVLPDESHHIDFELELAVVTDDVPLGTTPERALDHVVLVGIINDVSLRGLIAAELATGFGPITAKPSSCLSPVLVTPDELGSAWHADGIDLAAFVELNGELVAQPNARGMKYGFDVLISRAATTRRLGAGTVVGSGTVSNLSDEVGYACIAERRAVETATSGAPTTPFLKHGARFRMWMDLDGMSIFGTIDQRVVIS